MAVLTIIAICLITILAAWWDFRTYRIPLRFFLMILSGLMLLGFIIQPKILPPGESANYALLTDGADISTLSVSNYDSVFSIQSRKAFVNQRQPENVHWLSSVSLMERSLPARNAVEVFGYGTDELLSENYIWIDKLTPPERGLVLNDAPHEAEIGKPFSFNFQIESLSENDSLVVLKDGMMLTTVREDTSGKIEISDQLSSEGPVHYQIEWIQEDSVITENWNIRAIPPERLSVGMLLYSPLFEINYLAESLGERNHSITVRTRIGQNRFRYDDLNTPQISAENILSNPAAFDLLMIDVREYLQLQSTERNRIHEAAVSGLDILLIPPSVENLDKWTRVFADITEQDITFRELNRLEERLWSPDFVDPSLVEMNRIPLLNLDFQVLPEDSHELLEYQGDPIAIRTDVQNGSVSTHLFFQSYNWLLGGHPDIYHRFWADYLSNLITLEESFLNVATQIPRVDQPVTITFTPQNNPVSVQSVVDGNTITVPSSNRVNHPNVGSSIFWPKNSGWHVVQQAENRSWFYVYDSDWSFHKSYQTFRNTQQQIESQNKTDNFSDSSNNRKMPDWMWLISFLVLQGILWVERKMK